MRQLIAALTTGIVLIAAPGSHGAARAGDLLGIQAGIAVGTDPLAARPEPPPVTRRYSPAPVYAGPGPAPVPPPACYWTWGEPVWDGYGWVRPQVEVCD